MFLTLLSQTTTLLMAATCCWALLSGHLPERLTAVVYAMNWIGSALWEDRRPTHHGQPAWFALDAILLVFLLVLTVSYRRVWLLWMSAFSLLVVVSHLTVLLDITFSQWSYQTAYWIWSMGALLSFATGVAFESRRPADRLFRFG